MARDALDAGAEGYGLMTAAMGVGAVGGGLLIAARGRVGVRTITVAAVGLGTTLSERVG